MEIHSNTHRHEPLPGNQALGEQYKQFKALERIEQALINRSAQVILTCPVDIQAYYKENGSLEGLKAPGLGKKIKTDLLTILGTGIERALKNKNMAQVSGDSVGYAAPQALDLRNLQLNIQRDQRRLKED
jgi:hypothetical protein